MNFKEIIKEEWEKEFPNQEDSALRFDESIFYHAFGKIVDRICVRVWNEAVETVAHTVSEEPIISLKIKIDEQGTDTTEVF